jgi:hypothetical protein
LAQFSKRQGVSLVALQKANPGFTKNQSLTKGQVLLVPYRIGSGTMDRLTGDGDRKVARKVHRRSVKSRLRAR